MKKTVKIIVIAVTVLSLLLSIVTLFNIDWDENNPTDDSSVDLQEPPKNDNSDKVQLVLSDGVKSGVYFDTPSGTCVMLTDGYYAPGNYSLNQGEVNPVTYISTDAMYSSFGSAMGRIIFELEAGKTYYLWTDEEDPRN